MAILRHKSYICTNPAHVAPALAKYPTLRQQNLHLDEEYTDADLLPFTGGGVEGFVDFESPGPVAEDPTTFTPDRMRLAGYQVAMLKLAAEGNPPNCIGLYPVSGGGRNFDPTNLAWYAPGTALIAAEKVGNLFRHVDFVAADAYLKNDDPQFWLDTLDCTLRAFRAVGKPGVLFVSPRYMDPALTPPNRNVVNLDVWNARLWNLWSRQQAGDFQMAPYWDWSDLSGLDAAGQAAVLAAADAHAAKFAEVFPAA